jgi:hypothetical protein
MSRNIKVTGVFDNHIVGYQVIIHKIGDNPERWSVDKELMEIMVNNPRVIQVRNLPESANVGAMAIIKKTQDAGDSDGDVEQWEAGVRENRKPRPEGGSKKQKKHRGGSKKQKKRGGSKKHKKRDGSKKRS